VITLDRLRELLAAEGPNPRLVQVEGRVLVVDDSTAGGHPGAVDLVSRGDLVSMLGTSEPSDEELSSTAGALQTLVENRGG
jgi:hypothetical protein